MTSSHVAAGCSAPKGRSRRDPRPGRHRGADRRGRPSDAPAPFRFGVAEDLCGRGGARRDDVHARCLGRGDRALRHARHRPGGGPGGRPLTHRADRAGPADGLGSQGRRAYACTSLLARGSRWSGRREASRSSASTCSRPESPTRTASSSSAPRAPTSACWRPISGRGSEAAPTCECCAVCRSGRFSDIEAMTCSSTSRPNACARPRSWCGDLPGAVANYRAGAGARARQGGRAARPRRAGEGPWAVVDESGRLVADLRPARARTGEAGRRAPARSTALRADAESAAGDE